MAEVVEQSGSVKNALLGFKRGIELSQAAHCPARDGKHPQGVGEPTGFGAMKCEECRSELADTSESLKRSRIDKCEHHGFGWFSCVQADAVMKGVVIGA